MVAPLGRPAALLGRPRVRFGLALGAALVTLAPLAGALFAKSAPGLSHWLCSPATLRSALHAVGRDGLGAIEVHWPHFLPIPVGLGTLVYLCRADRRYRASGSPDRPYCTTDRPYRPSYSSGASAE